MIVKNIILSAMAAVILGCDRAPETGTTAKAVSELHRFSDFEADDVLVRVNGEPITCADFRRVILLEADIKKASGAFDQSPDDYEKFKIWREQSLLPELIRALLIKQEFERQGLKVSDAAADGVRRDLEERIGHGFSFASYAKEKGFSQRNLKDWLSMGLRAKPLVEKLYPDLTAIGSNDLREVRGRMKWQNEQFAASNAVLRARAEKALAAARTSSSFEEVGRAFSWTNVEESVRWGRFARQEIESEKLKEWAFSAKVGDVGGPFETDYGLSIVKVLDHEEGARDMTPMALRVEQVELARILIPQLETHPEVSDEVLRQQIYAVRFRESEQEVLKRIFDAAQIEYPHGSEFKFSQSSTEQ